MKFIKQNVCKIYQYNLLCYREANPELCDVDGLTPLMIAAEKGHMGVVNLLVENGAKLDIQDKDDQTFFHICAEYNQSDIIKVKTKKDIFYFWIKKLVSRQ